MVGLSVEGPVVVAEPPSLEKRLTIQRWALDLAGKKRREDIAEALSALGLWDDRRVALTNLTPGLRQAAYLLPCLLEPSDLIVIDQLADGLDPWTSEGFWTALEARCATGSAVVLSTHRVDLALRGHGLIVLGRHGGVFAGAIGDLIDRTDSEELHVETDRPELVRQISAPFVLEAEETPYGMKLTSPRGQELSARLLLEGYGSIKAVHRKRISLESAVLQMIRATDGVY